MISTRCGEKPWVRFSRGLLRFYLSRFPLRDGKGYLYRNLQERLLPPERWQTIKVRQGFRLRLDLADPAQRQIYFFGEYDERHEIRLLQKIVQPGDCFWDIGANIGFYTLTAARLVGPQGQVRAFEPSAPAWQALNDNVALNPCHSIRLVRLALSDRAGPATLHRRGDYADGGASLISREGYHQEKEVVTMLSLDAYLAQTGGPPPTFLKIDVEGHEERVLAGAQTLLQSLQPPLILIEMNDPAGISRILQVAGYQGTYLHCRRWRLAENPIPVKSRNMFWFRADAPLHRERLALVGLYV